MRVLIADDDPAALLLPGERAGGLGLRGADGDGTAPKPGTCSGGPILRR